MKSVLSTNAGVNWHVKHARQRLSSLQHLELLDSNLKGRCPKGGRGTLSSRTFPLFSDPTLSVTVVCKLKTQKRDGEGTLVKHHLLHAAERDGIRMCNIRAYVYATLQQPHVTL